jgi:hypothetical protein
LVIYARNEPTDDPEKDNQAYRRGFAPTGQAYPFYAAMIAKKKDVQLYYDQETTKPAVRCPWHYKKPTRRNKRVCVNCGNYDLMWLPNL